MVKSPVFPRRSVVRIMVLSFIMILSGLFYESVSADPGMPLRRMPICGDQDGSEVPLVFNCAEFIHVPDVQTYQLPGSGSSTFRADFIYREATYNNELGFYRVDDSEGAIGGLGPGEPGYMEAALSRAQTIFASGSNAYVPDYSTELQGGQILVFYIVQNSSLAQLRARNPNNELGKSPIAFFSIDALNPDRIDHFVGFTKVGGRLTQFGFEDLTNGGDRDYDDVSYNIDSPISPLPHAGLLSLPFEHEEGDRGLPHVYSFFDHQYPLYGDKEPVSSRATLMTFTGQTLQGTLESCAPGLSCYSGHSGTDFSFGLPSGSAVLAAADGTVRSGTERCGGNYVYIDHGDYQTAYLHLQDDHHWVKSGEVEAGERIGTVGNSGSCTTGAHLHFAVYYDQNGDDRFAWPDEQVDPFGWRDQCATAATDPWTQRFQDANNVYHTGATSKWLWDFSQPSCVVVAANAAYSFLTPEGILVDVPQGAINIQATLGVSAATEPGQGMGAQGYLELERSSDAVLDTISVVGAVQFSAVANDSRPLDSFGQPVRMTIPYTEADLVYGDEGALSIYQLDIVTDRWILLPAEFDTNVNQVTVLMNRPGILSLRSRPIHPSPTITSVTPTMAGNNVITTITIFGQGFFGTNTVNVGESSLQVVTASSTRITALVPEHMTAGRYDLVVRNPDGQIAVAPNAFQVRGMFFIPGAMR